MGTLTQVEYLGATLEIVLKERDEARRQREQLEEALQDTVKLIEHIDWTAFSLADRAVLDNARAVLAALDKERAG